MSGPSEKAIEAAHDALQDQIGWKGHRGEVRERVKGLLGAAHDSALGLDRSVRLRDAIEIARGIEWEGTRKVSVELERRLGGGS